MTSFKELNITGLLDPHELSPDRCLQPDEFMDYHHPDIQTKVQELTNGLNDPWNKAEAIFRFVRDEIIYDFAPKITGPENWKASVILKEKEDFVIKNPYYRQHYTGRLESHLHWFIRM